MTYSIYALRVRCSRPVPAMVPMPATPEVDVDIRLEAGQSWCRQLERGRPCWYTSPTRDEQGEPILTAWTISGGELLLLRYADGAEFVVSRAGTEVWAGWPDTLTVDDVSVYLLGPILGLVLRLRGVTCLHGSAIDIGGEAVAVIGPPEAGKSTTAALFARDGYSVLADDVVALTDQDQRFLVQPAYPRLGLWSDSVAALFGSPDALPRQTPTWDKRYLDLTRHGYTFQPRPLPLRAVYVLGERQASPAAPCVAPVPAALGLTYLVENAYVSYLLDRDMRARDFDRLARVASTVAVRRVVPHTDTAYMRVLRDVIVEDVRRLKAVRPMTIAEADAPRTGPLIPV